MDPNTLIYAFFLPFVWGVVGGGLAYVAVHWGHLRFQLGLDYRLSDLEGRVSREVKIRAADTHQNKKAADTDLLDQIKASKTEQPMTLDVWTKKAFNR